MKHIHTQTPMYPQPVNYVSTTLILKNQSTHILTHFNDLFYFPSLQVLFSSTISDSLAIL